MRKLVLLPHNGVFGTNPVEPYAGDEIDAGEITLADAAHPENGGQHDGRFFSFAYAENVGQPDETLFYRERKFGEPSDWAKAREAERAARG